MYSFSGQEVGSRDFSPTHYTFHYTPSGRPLLGELAVSHVLVHVAGQLAHLISLYLRGHVMGIHALGARA